MLWIVATCKDIRNNVIGYRVYDSDTGNMIDTPYNSVYGVILNGIEIANIKIANNKIVGSNGDLKNYCAIKCGVVMDKAPVVVIKEYLDTTYDVLIPNGVGCEKIRMSLCALIMANEMNGIANASIVTNGNRTKFIRGIGREIEKETPINVKKVAKNAATLAGIADSVYTVEEDGSVVLVDKQLFIAQKTDKIILPNNIFKIGDYALSRTYIKTFKCPNKLLEIGSGSFKDCKDLEKISLNVGLRVIKRLAFSGCIKLKEVSIPATVTLIESSAFGKGLNKIVLHNRRTQLAPNAVDTMTRIVYE